MASRSGRPSPGRSSAFLPLPTEAGTEDDFHQLSERLTSTANYLEVLRKMIDAGASPVLPRHAEVADKALAQLGAAVDVFHRLRRTFAAPNDEPPNHDYRICFMNDVNHGGKNITACQRSIVVRSAASPELAIEAAKQRFAELEGICDWHIRASTIEVKPIEGQISAKAE